MACLVEVAVIFTRLLRCAARGNDNFFAFLQQRLDQPGLSVIPFVCNDCLSQSVFEQNVGTLQIMALPRCEVKPSGIAQRIDCCMDFGAQATTTAPKRLFLQAPPFAPALCWWARTMVESIMAYSLSASCANASKMRFHTPLLLQRE